VFSHISIICRVVVPLGLSATLGVGPTLSVPAMIGIVTAFGDSVAVLVMPRLGATQA
jgi:predicted histidine transporter YuiF (NhaC family)